MEALSEYLLPLIFVVAIVVISLHKGTDKKKEEEMAKTMLPGRKSGEVIVMPEVVPVPSVQKMTNKLRNPIPQPLEPTENFSRKSPVSISKDHHEEEVFEPVLNIEDVDDIKKAVIYTEIFNRKEF